MACGCWRTASSGVPDTDFAPGRHAIHAAVDAGCTLFEHADIYCASRAESVFGAALKETPDLRQEMVVFTKCGIRFVGESGPESPYLKDEG